MHLQIDRRTVTVLALLFTSVLSAAQDIAVTAANPAVAEQGVTLDVEISGSGFKKGARAAFLITGTTNPGGITVNSTAFVNPNKLVANITVAPDAQTELKYDITVTAAGRTGKGIELFGVLKGNLDNASYDACTQRQANGARLEPVPGVCPAGGAGCVDVSFGSGGQVVESSLGAGGGSGWAGALQLDPATGHARILTGLHSSTAGVMVVGYTLDGNRDVSFGQNGVAVAAASFGSSDFIRDIAIQPDGKIVVVWGGEIFRVSRLQPSGALDTSFGTNGQSTVDFVSSNKKVTDYVRAVALQSDGKILVVGDAGAHWGLARLNPNGTLDSSFGTGGQVIFNAGGSNGGFAGAWSVTTQFVGAEERVLVAGRAVVNRLLDYGIARFHADGSLDSTFGTAGTGLQTLDFFGFADTPWTLLTDALGRIVVSGMSETDDCMASLVFSVARFTPDGYPDRAFGNAAADGQRTGWTSANLLSREDVAREMAIDAAGRLVLGGYARILSGEIRFAVVRLLEDGTLDPAFGDRGAVTMIFNNAVSQGGRAVVLDPFDGGIILFGWASDYLALTKFLP